MDIVVVQGGRILEPNAKNLEILSRCEELDDHCVHLIQDRKTFGIDLLTRSQQLCTQLCALLRSFGMNTSQRLEWLVTLLAENRRSSRVTLQGAAIGVTRPEGRREAGNWIEGARLGDLPAKVSVTSSRENVVQATPVNIPRGPRRLSSYYW